MRGKNAIVYRILACFIITILLLGYMPAPSNAGSPSAPTDLEVSEITSTSATLTWAKSPSAKSYKVYKNGDSCASPTDNTVQITGLSPSTTYLFRVSGVKNNDDEGDKSVALSVTTLPAVPSAPTGLAASAITQTSTTLTWTATPGAASYKVYKDGNLSESLTDNAASITGLTASTTYSFTVSAVNTSGEGAKSADSPVTTLPPGPIFEVLEIQPSTTYDLTPSLLSGVFPNRTISLTKMSMPEFISKVDEINGKYDIVYVGNNTTDGVLYTALGRQTTSLPQGGSSSAEYYSDNDITNRRANTLKDFVNSNQFTMFDDSILNSGSTLKTTKLYKNFSTVNRSNFTKVITTSSKIANLTARLSTYNTGGVVTKRPVLKLNSQPLVYDGTDTSYQTTKSLGFNFDINNQTNLSNMTVKLYIDVNGDGIYKATDNYAGKPEVVTEMKNKSTALGYTLNYHLPDSFVGLQPWKLEITDTLTASTGSEGTKSYVTGATAFQGIGSGDEVNIRLLQLVPVGNTLSIYSLKNVDNQNLLYKDKVYRIQVTEMTVDDFDAAYVNLPANPTPLPKPAKIYDVTKGNFVATATAPTALNENYDMVVMGFADTYGSNGVTDLKNPYAIQAIKDFINTNQSVMFTHDTLTYQVNSPNTWGYNITQNFRSIVGQQRYYPTPPTDTRYYDPMPNATKYSYGFSNLTLDRASTGKFQTTTQTHKLNDNLVTQFPFPLGDIVVAPTHQQYFQLDLEDENVVPVYTLKNDSSSTIFDNPGDGRNDYYTYTKGNITYSGTGHSPVNGSDEKKMFINTIIKASRGANHAPTLEVNGISDGMDIANSLTSIDFSYTATDIDPNDQFLNAVISLSTSSDGINFGDYQKVVPSDPEASRIKSGLLQSVSIPKVAGSSIKAYKVKLEVRDSFGASVSKELKLNNVAEPQISVDSFTTSCLVGDTITIPVNVTAAATTLTETFKNIFLQSNTTKLQSVGSAIPIGLPHQFNNYPNLTFNPNPSWPGVQNSYQLKLGTLGDSSSAGTYQILNNLTYDAYTVVPPAITSRTNDQPFNIIVRSGTIEVELLDLNLRGIPGITTTVSGPLPNSAIVAPITTGPTGLSSFMGLSSGDYTVTVVVRDTDGRTIDIPSKTVSLSANTPTQKVTFNMGGDLIANPSITTIFGNSQMSILKNMPLQSAIGLTLNRNSNSLTVNLSNSLASNMTIDITKVYCNNQEISFTKEGTNLMTIRPSLPSTPFPRGTYKIEAKITLSGVTLQAGQVFTIPLTRITARDAATTSEETIVPSNSFLRINVMAPPKLH